VERYQPPRRFLHLLNLPPFLDPLSKPPPKMCRFNKRDTYISTSQAHDCPTMSIESDMNVSGSSLTPISFVISGVPLNTLSSMVWMLEATSSNVTQPMVSAQPVGINPFLFPSGISNHSTQSIPLATNPFSFGISDMTAHLSSSISSSYVNPSFGSKGMMPHSPFSFGGGHIP
jgi:hypothetical protein